MHELSLAAAIADVVERHAAGRRVLAVNVRVGALRQVVPSALSLAFELVSRETVLQDARLELEHVDARGLCERCGAERALPALPLACSSCGSLDVRLTAGEELTVEEVEVEQEVVAA